jgi:hypothetical protein
MTIDSQERDSADLPANRGLYGGRSASALQLRYRLRKKTGVSEVSPANAGEGVIFNWKRDVGHNHI